MAAVFAYGTLLFPAVMEAVTGRRFGTREAELAGYARRRLRRRIYPAAVASPGERVAGRLYEGVDAATLARLDRFEGDLYERRRVSVAPAEGGAVAAELYVVVAARRGELLDEPWDPEEFASAHLAAYLRSCAAFRARDEARSGAAAGPDRG
jgi:gamma-glutamylcyclotransferase (GGCT)/AIG2-like uncharacterized protein YtfP